MTKTMPLMTEELKRELSLSLIACNSSANR